MRRDLFAENRTVPNVPPLPFMRSFRAHARARAEESSSAQQEVSADGQLPVVLQSFLRLHPEYETLERLNFISTAIRPLKEEYEILSDRGMPKSKNNLYRFRNPLMRAYVRLRMERERQAPSSPTEAETPGGGSPPRPPARAPAGTKAVRKNRATERPITPRRAERRPLAGCATCHRNDPAARGHCQAVRSVDADASEPAVFHALPGRPRPPTQPLRFPTAPDRPRESRPPVPILGPAQDQKSRRPRGRARPLRRATTPRRASNDRSSQSLNRVPRESSLRPRPLRRGRRAGPPSGRTA